MPIMFIHSPVQSLLFTKKKREKSGPGKYGETESLDMGIQGEVVDG